MTVSSTVSQKAGSSSRPNCAANIDLRPARAVVVVDYGGVLSLVPDDV